MFATRNDPGRQGGAGRSTPELEAKREWFRLAAERAGDAPHGDPNDSERSKWMGRCHNFKIPLRLLPDGTVDEHRTKIDLTIATRKWLVGM